MYYSAYKMRLKDFDNLMEYTFHLSIRDTNPKKIYFCIRTEYKPSFLSI